jgi:hypothetical protein
MPIVNADVATVFDEIADLLEVQGANTPTGTQHAC